MSITLIEVVARKVAEMSDYLWEFVPEHGKEAMRNHAKGIIDIVLSAQPALEPIESTTDRVNARARGDYLAAIAAAPQPPQGKVK